MLALPAFLLRGSGLRADRAGVDDAFRLTGFFLVRHVYEPRGISEPEARASFLSALRRNVATDCGRGGRCGMSAVEIYPGRVSLGGVGTFSHEALATSSGRELLQGIVDGTNPCPPMAVLLSFTIAEVDDGRVVFLGMPNEKHAQPLGSWCMAAGPRRYCNSALFCAVVTQLERGEFPTTAEFKINFLRPVTADTGEIVCEARVVNKGRTLAVAEATAKDPARQAACLCHRDLPDNARQRHGGK